MHTKLLLQHSSLKKMDNHMALHTNFLISHDKVMQTNGTAKHICCHALSWRIQCTSVHTLYIINCNSQASMLIYGTALGMEGCGSGIGGTRIPRPCNIKYILEFSLKSIIIESLSQIAEHQDTQSNNLIA